MSSLGNDARLPQDFADERKREDALTQRKTIVGDQDGFWLAEQIEELHASSTVIRSSETRRYQFLDDDAEVILDQLNQHGSGSVIEMPAGSTVRCVKGDGFRTWLFRVDNGLPGDENEWFELAYRKITTGAHLLYLKSCHCGRAAHSR